MIQLVICQVKINPLLGVKNMKSHFKDVLGFWADCVEQVVLQRDSDV